MASNRVSSERKAANRRLTLMAWLLTGAAVIGASASYISGHKDDKLAVLDVDLPPVVGEDLAPPPYTYFTREEPDATIPGIRRLKVLRPELRRTPAQLRAGADQKAGETGVVAPQASDADYYLTGTKSASLIREPVEARIETFPTITVEQAAEGALAVDEFGFQVVQNYFNQALGDGDQLKARLSALIQLLEEAMVSGDYPVDDVTGAIDIVIEAAARAYRAAFMAPFVLDNSFRLKEGSVGFDLGPDVDEPYTDFVRVGAQSELLIGKDMKNLTEDDGPTILTDGVDNVEQMVVGNLQDGQHRLVILTSPKPDGSEPLYPFGVDYKQNGTKVNMVDTRATDTSVPMMKLATEGPGRFGAGSSGDRAFNGAGHTPNSEKARRLFASAGIPVSDAFYVSAPQDNGPNNGPNNQGGNGGDNYDSAGYMLVTRTTISDATLRLDFKQLGEQQTYITALILYFEEDDTVPEDVQDEIVRLLDRIETAAGNIENQSAFQQAQQQQQAVQEIFAPVLPVVDPVTAFEDNEGGLPTEEGSAAAPTTPTVNPTTGGGNNQDGEQQGDTGGNGQAGDGAVGSGGDVGGPQNDTGAGDGDGTDTGGDTGGGTGGGDTGGGVDPVADPVLIAEAGVYDPIPLGEAFTLNACGSTLESVSVCDLAAQEGFELTFLLGDTEIGTGETVLVDDELLAQLFSETGDYDVTLEVRFDGSFLGASGGTIQFVDGGGSIFLPGDVILTSIDTAVINIFTSVPEPAGLLLLVPGLAFVARRERRKRATQKASAQAS